MRPPASSIKPKRTASTYVGVAWDGSRGTWRARVTLKGRQFFIGRFADEHEAAQAFDCAMLALMGARARLNFGMAAAAAASHRFEAHTSKLLLAIPGGAKGFATAAAAAAATGRCKKQRAAACERPAAAAAAAATQPSACASVGGAAAARLTAEAAPSTSASSLSASDAWSGASGGGGSAAAAADVADDADFEALLASLDDSALDDATLHVGPAPSPGVAAGTAPDAAAAAAAHAVEAMLLDVLPWGGAASAADGDDALLCLGIGPCTYEAYDPREYVCVCGDLQLAPAFGTDAALWLPGH